MGARPVPAPLEVRPRCGLRAVAQTAVLARLRAHVIARVVGTGWVVGEAVRANQYYPVNKSVGKTERCG